MQELIELWRAYYPQVSEGSLLDKLALDIYMDNNLLKRINWSMITKSDEFINDPKFGTKTFLVFYWDKKEVQIKRGEETQVLSLEKWLNYLRIVDLIFSNVLPLGSIVKLEEERIPKNILKKFKGNSAGLCIQLTARRVAINEEGYIDYLGSIWPTGFKPDLIPILIPSYSIAEVIFEGYKNEVDKEYILETKKRNLKDKIYSRFYSELERMVQE